MAGAQCQLVEEDDISLSSSIEDDKHNENDEDEDRDKGDAEESKEQQDSFNDDDDENDDVVDLTKSPQMPVPQPSKTPDNDNEDDPQRRQSKLRRLSRIAKKFKKQYLQKSSQYKEQYAEKRKLSDRVRQAEGELKRIQEEMSEAERDRELYELNLRESRLDLIRIKHDRDVLKSRYSTMANEKSRAEARLLECRSHYELELENARSKSMSEVQEIMEKHPKVVEENRVLKQKLHKLNRSLSRGGSNNIESSSSRCHSKAKNINKELRELDQLIRFRPNTASSKTTVAAARKGINNLAGSGLENRNNQPRRPSIFDSARYHDPTRNSSSKNSSSSSSHTRGSASASIKVNSGQYSSLASRMMKASQKAVKRPPLQGGAVDVAGGKKRSSAITALSLSQNKRMKSYSASRRDLVKRKP